MPSSAQHPDELVTHRFAPGGETIFREGDLGECAYVVERGEIEVSIERDGRRIVLARRRPGEVVGEMAILDNAPRAATATALVDSVLLTITAAQIQDRLEQADPVLRMCLEAVLTRFRDTLRAMRSCGSSAPVDPLVGSPRDETPLVRAAVREIRLEQEIARGIARGEFELHFQPIVHLASNTLAGFEALVRWNHPERGQLPPGFFIRAAESSGLIVPLGRWVLRSACAALRLCRGRARMSGLAGRSLFMNVNVSGRDLADSGFAEDVGAALREAGIAAHELKLEVTESLLIDEPERAVATLAACRRLGVSIAIDDFGTGYSSLAYLHRLPIDVLKIDRSFVRAMVDTPSSHPILGTIADLARQLAKPVVGEGVETAAQAEGLKRLGYTYGQGFLYAPGVPLHEAARIAAAWSRGGVPAAGAPSATTSSQPRSASKPARYPRSLEPCASVA